MLKLIPVDDAIRCELCRKLLGHGRTYGYAFYCDPCLAKIEADKKSQLR